MNTEINLRPILWIIGVGFAAIFVSWLFYSVDQAREGRSARREQEFNSYMSVCQQAGHTAEECLFARHHPFEAYVLGGQ